MWCETGRSLRTMHTENSVDANSCNIEELQAYNLTVMPIGQQRAINHSLEV